MKQIKFGNIVGSFYCCHKVPRKLIIIALGAPNREDIESLSYVDLYLEAGYDVVAPEYYGYSRSAGVFTPENSIKTLLDTKNIFQDGIVQDISHKKDISVSYENILFVGMSYGAGVVALLPKYDKTIENIALIYPVLHYENLGKAGVPEESADDFYSCISKDFSDLYRGIDEPIWRDHFLDKTDFIPDQNIKYLGGVKIFLAHGKADSVIYYQRTKLYYEKVSEMFPGNKISYCEYPGGHDKETLKSAIYDLIGYFKC